MKRTSVFRAKIIPKPQKKSKVGFPAYERTPEENIVNILMTGSTANLFYATAKENIEDIVKTLKEYKNTEFLAKATIYAREKGFMRTIPIASLVEISRRDPKLFRKVFPRICLTPKDTQQFIDICRGKMIRYGLGTAPKKAIIKQLKEMSTYHAIKYPKAVEDMINVARPRPEINPIVINYIKNKKIPEENIQLNSLKKLKEAKTEEDVIKAIREGRLPFEIIFGSLPPNIKSKKAIWKELLYVAPYFNLIRNLSNFISYGVFEEEKDLNYAIEKIKNENLIKESKLLPFRFYTAYTMIKNLNNVREKIKSELCSALEKALETSIINVPETKENIAIASDVSGSMRSSVTSDESIIQCCDLVGVFTACLIKKCKTIPTILPFNVRVREDIAQKVYKAETILEIAKCFPAKGGTSLSAPVEYLLKENIEVDRIIAFTDNEEWVGRTFLEALTDYIDYINPNVRVYLVTLLPYRDYPIPKNNKFRNVHFIFGWSSHVLNYVLSDEKTQIEEINKIKI